MEDYHIGLEFGYDYFQGYFFSKPEIIKGTGIPDNKLNQVRILGEIYKKDVGFNDLENIFKTDVSLSFKLLKFVNSSYFGFKNEVKSIKRALVMLGLFEIKKWVSIVALNNLKSNNKPDELIITSLVRATFFEKLATSSGKNNIVQECFLLGMFTIIDALLSKPMLDILTEFPIDNEIKAALINRNNTENNEISTEKSKNFYTDLINILFSIEKTNWEELENNCKEINLQENEVALLYRESIEIADKIYGFN